MITHDIGYIIISTQNTCTTLHTVDIHISLITHEPTQVITAGSSEYPRPRIAPALISYTAVNNSSVVAMIILCLANTRTSASVVYIRRKNSLPITNIPERIPHDTRATLPHRK